MVTFIDREVLQPLRSDPHVIRQWFNRLNPHQQQHIHT